MRLRSRSDFQRSRKHGKSFGGKFLVLSVLSDPEASPFRFGIILTKKVGNAVVRNRVRRRVRGLLSKFGEEIAPGHRLVIIARYTAPSAPHADLEKDWQNLLQRAGILNPEALPGG
jgi:ribonuclease P protein component